MQYPPLSELHWFELNNFYKKKKKKEKKILSLSVQKALGSSAQTKCSGGSVNKQEQCALETLLTVGSGAPV